MPDPLHTFQQAVDALQQERWADLALLCDPASLERFRNEQIRMLAPEHPHPRATAEQLMRHDPLMPREAAEYQIAMMERHGRTADRLEREFPGVAGMDELRAMHPADLFAVWLRGHSRDHQARMAIRDGHVPEEYREEFLASVGGGRISFVALGAVPDGDGVAHVLYRQEFHAPVGDQSVDVDDRWIVDLSPAEQELARDLAGREFPQVATCRRQPDGEWRLLAGFDFLQMGQWVVSVGYDESDQTVDG